MVRCQPHLAAEDAIPDNGIEQHEGVDKDARTPEHERKAGVGGCAGVDRDGKRNHVGPERKRERAEGRILKKGNIKDCSILGRRGLSGPLRWQPKASEGIVPVKQNCYFEQKGNKTVGQLPGSSWIFNGRCLFSF
jgi:hypothetical protein